MTMPKTTIDENSQMIFWKDKIRLPYHIVVVKPESEPLLMNFFSYK